MNTNTKTLILDVTTENCEVEAIFSERDIFEEARLQLEGINAYQYVPGYEDGTLDKYAAIEKIIETIRSGEVWADNEDEYESDYEVSYQENYPLYGTPAITIKYWAMDNCLDRWVSTYIAMPEKNK